MISNGLICVICGTFSDEKEGKCHLGFLVTRALILVQMADY